MAKEKAKGSILLELLIVVLALALIGTIMYPKSVWETTEKETLQCRENMEKILKTELIYLKYHNTYQDTLDKVISFIKEDTTGGLVLEYLYADSSLAEEVLAEMTGTIDGADKKIKDFLADTLLTTVLQMSRFDTNLARVTLKRLESTDAWKDTVKNNMVPDSSEVFVLNEVAQKISARDIVGVLENDDSLKIVMQRIAPELTVGSLVDTLYNQNPEWAGKINTAVYENFDAIVTCPTNGEPYMVTVVDTSVIKILNIGCPIDEDDLNASKSNFLKYHIGHQRLENHGAIEGGEKSWNKE